MLKNDIFHVPVLDYLDSTEINYLESTEVDEAKQQQQVEMMSDCIQTIYCNENELVSKKMNTKKTTEKRPRSWLDALSVNVENKSIADYNGTNSDDLVNYRDNSYNFDFNTQTHTDGIDDLYSKSFPSNFLNNTNLIHGSLSSSVDAFQSSTEEERYNEQYFEEPLVIDSTDKYLYQNNSNNNEMLNRYKNILGDYENSMIICNELQDLNKNGFTFNDSTNANMQSSDLASRKTDIGTTNGSNYRHKQWSDSDLDSDSDTEEIEENYDLWEESIDDEYFGLVPTDCDMELPPYEEVVKTLQMHSGTFSHQDIMNDVQKNTTTAIPASPTKNNELKSQIYYKPLLKLANEGSTENSKNAGNGQRLPVGKALYTPEMINENFSCPLTIDICEKSFKSGKITPLEIIEKEKQIQDKLNSSSLPDINNIVKYDEELEKEIRESIALYNNVRELKEQICCRSLPEIMNTEKSKDKNVKVKHILQEISESMALYQNVKRLEEQLISLSPPNSKTTKNNRTNNENEKSSTNSCNRRSKSDKENCDPDFIENQLKFQIRESFAGYKRGLQQKENTRVIKEGQCCSKTLPDPINDDCDPFYSDSPEFLDISDDEWDLIDQVCHRSLFDNSSTNKLELPTRDASITQDYPNDDVTAVPEHPIKIIESTTDKNSDIIEPSTNKNVVTSSRIEPSTNIVTSPSRDSIDKEKDSLHITSYVPNKQHTNTSNNDKQQTSPKNITVMTSHSADNNIFEIPNTSKENNKVLTSNDSIEVSTSNDSIEVSTSNDRIEVLPFKDESIELSKQTLPLLKSASDIDTMTLNTTTLEDESKHVSTSLKSPSSSNNLSKSTTDSINTSTLEDESNFLHSPNKLNVSTVKGSSDMLCSPTTMSICDSDKIEKSSSKDVPSNPLPLLPSVPKIEDENSSDEARISKVEKEDRKSRISSKPLKENVTNPEIKDIVKTLDSVIDDLEILRTSNKKTENDDASGNSFIVTETINAADKLISQQSENLGESTPKLVKLTAKSVQQAEKSTELTEKSTDETEKSIKKSDTQTERSDKQKTNDNTETDNVQRIEMKFSKTAEKTETTTDSETGKKTKKLTLNFKGSIKRNTKRVKKPRVGKHQINFNPLDLLNVAPDELSRINEQQNKISEEKMTEEKPDIETAEAVCEKVSPLDSSEKEKLNFISHRRVIAPQTPLDVSRMIVKTPEPEPERIKTTEKSHLSMEILTENPQPEQIKSCVLNRAQTVMIEKEESELIEMYNNNHISTKTSNKESNPELTNSINKSKISSEIPILEPESCDATPTPVEIPTTINQEILKISKPEIDKTNPLESVFHHLKTVDSNIPPLPGFDIKHSDDKLDLKTLSETISDVDGTCNQTTDSDLKRAITSSKPFHSKEKENEMNQIVILDSQLTADGKHNVEQDFVADTAATIPKGDNEPNIVSLASSYTNIDDECSQKDDSELEHASCNIDSMQNNNSNPNGNEISDDIENVDTNNNCKDNTEISLDKLNDDSDQILDAANPSFDITLAKNINLLSIDKLIPCQNTFDEITTSCTNKPQNDPIGTPSIDASPDQLKINNEDFSSNEIEIHNGLKNASKLNNKDKDKIEHESKDIEGYSRLKDTYEIRKKNKDKDENKNKCHLRSTKNKEDNYNYTSDFVLVYLNTKGFYNRSMSLPEMLTCRTEIVKELYGNYANYANYANYDNYNNYDCGQLFTRSLSDMSRKESSEIMVIFHYDQEQRQKMKSARQQCSLNKKKLSEVLIMLKNSPEFTKLGNYNNKKERKCSIKNNLFLKRPGRKCFYPIQIPPLSEIVNTKNTRKNHTTWKTLKRPRLPSFYDQSSTLLDLEKISRTLSENFNDNVICEDSIHIENEPKTCIYENKDDTLDLNNKDNYLLKGTNLLKNNLDTVINHNYRHIDGKNVLQNIETSKKMEVEYQSIENNNNTKSSFISLPPQYYLGVETSNDINRVIPKPLYTPIDYITVIEEEMEVVEYTVIEEMLEVSYKVTQDKNKIEFACTPSKTLL